MITEKMTYSQSAVKECKEMIAKIRKTVPRKNEHFARANEIIKVSEKCFELTGCMLFLPDWAEQLEGYRRHSYNHKLFSKSQLDKELKSAVRYLSNEINSIETAMLNGEVDTCM